MNVQNKQKEEDIQEKQLKYYKKTNLNKELSSAIRSNKANLKAKMAMSKIEDERTLDGNMTLFEQN
jgi:hypothetical protein